MNPDFTPAPPEMPATPIVDGQLPPPQQSSKKKVVVIGAVLVVLVLSTAVWTVLHKSSTDNTNGSAVAISNDVASISIGSGGYAPQAITVKEGQPVMFTNAAGASRQLSADASLLPGFSTVEPLDQGDAYTYVFERKGTFHYYDATDPTNFVGTITVD
ncbi:MAG TPA: hypothetical protein VLF59_02030 [Candidatus Saccharimonadales bacterium]|nr:hypothetical protein [Candidatus Saccharimonadales bacterium]